MQAHLSHGEVLPPAARPLPAKPVAGQAVGTTLSLARTSGLLAFRLARWALVGLVRRQPAPILTVGFGAGLLARAALTGLAGSRQLPVPATPPPAKPELFAVEVETIVVRTTRLFRRA